MYSQDVPELKRDWHLSTQTFRWVSFMEQAKMIAIDTSWRSIDGTDQPGPTQQGNTYRTHLKNKQVRRTLEIHARR